VLTHIISLIVLLHGDQISSSLCDDCGLKQIQNPLNTAVDITVTACC